MDYYNATMAASDYKGKMARRYARHAQLEQLLTEPHPFLH
jgi:hypothetical protein